MYECSRILHSERSPEQAGPAPQFRQKAFAWSAHLRDQLGNDRLGLGATWLGASRSRLRHLTRED
jgi:hypothetical protein